MSTTKPKLSFWQIWNMSFGFLGIQFGWALQLANVSRVFQTLGADVGDIAILWIAAPVTGLIVQPIVGHFSDHTWGRFGRRRPYFAVGAIFASIALLIMPNSPTVWVAAGMLWIMDASINISMEPFRAFVGDMLPSEQRTKGFAMQSFFIGTGSVIASILPFLLTNWFGISNISEEGEIPMSLKISFYTGAIVFLSAVLWTVFSTKEYTPEEMDAFHEAEEKEKGNTPATTVSQHIPASTFLKQSPIWLISGIILTFLILNFVHHKEPIILSLGLIIFGVILLVAGLLTKSGKTDNGFVEIINDLFKMPETMKQLAWVQFFTWFGLFSMFLYMTPAITSHVYGTSDTTSELYNDGADWVGILFATYNFFAAIFAFLLSPLAKKTSRRMTHLMSLIIGGVGLMSIYVLKDPYLLLFSMVGVGLAWTSILAMPYAMLTNSLPAKKFGIYMGIFNFFIVIPEITASSIYGFLMENLFNNQSIYVLITGGLSLIVAGLLCLRVDDKED